MIKFIVCLFLLITNAFALDAVVTVLETPMLKYKSYDAPVVQYLRKGDVIKLHGAYIKSTRYDLLAPSPAKIAKLKQEKANSSEWKDPLFQGEPEEVKTDDEFVPTLDRQGNKVYVIRDHLYVYYGTSEEFNETTLRKDPTDYRLEEPLPEKYPLYKEHGYRGQVTLGVTQPYFESYPYQANIKNKGYMSPIDLNITFLRQRPTDHYDRQFYGVTFNFRHYSNSYQLFNEVFANEKGFRFGLGPFYSYDVYKATKNRISLYGNINVNLFNHLNISQEDGNLKEQRNYRATSFTPRIGAQYHRKKILPDVDFVIGTAMEMEPSTTFHSITPGGNPEWWNELGDDKFKTRTTFTVSGYIGFQSAY